MAIQFRTETDSMGAVKVPLKALYGAQTQRALNNFTISSEVMPAEFIGAVLMIKRGAAQANCQLKLLSSEQAEAISWSIDQLQENDFAVHFPVPVLQTGSGTSTNMNVNEVLSSLAKQQGVNLSPNDHINLGQSSNDVIPSALHISSAIHLTKKMIPALRSLRSTISEQSEAHRDVVKTGRTHLMDALPIRLSNELMSWASQVDDCIIRFESVLDRLVQIPLGGTAVGSGVNSHPDFIRTIMPILRRISGLALSPMASAYKGLSSIDTALELSGHLKTTACVLMKLANDLRWMNSGPGAGLGEISLQPLQPGSSIMPDKVNPVIPEAICMAAAQVIGNDTTVTIAAQSGNFQLNTMLPLTAAKILESSSLIAGAAKSLGEKAISTVRINKEHMSELLTHNPILVTALAPHIGYLKAAQLAKKARKEDKSILEVAKKDTDLPSELLESLLDPVNLADGGRS